MWSGDFHAIEMRTSAVPPTLNDSWSRAVRYEFHACARVRCGRGLSFGVSEVDFFPGTVWHFFLPVSLHFPNFLFFGGRDWGTSIRAETNQGYWASIREEGGVS